MNQPILRQATYAHNLCENRVLLKKKPDSNTLYYYLYNGHRDVIGILYDNGTVANTYDYDEFGNTVAEQEKTYNPFKYAGEYQDAESGLYYLNARYYDPSMGRFINEDTVEGQISNPLTLNIYTYVTNNPLVYVDPTGHDNVLGAGGGSTVTLTDPWKGWSGPVGNVLNFFILDDINTLRDPGSSNLAKSLAAAGFVPVGKVFKSGKLILSLVDDAGNASKKEFKLTGDALNYANKCNCFIAGTKVHT